MIFLKTAGNLSSSSFFLVVCWQFLVFLGLLLRNTDLCLDCHTAVFLVCPCAFVFTCSYSIHAAITKFHKLGDTKKLAFISHSSESWRSKIRMPAWSGRGELSSRFQTSYCFLAWYKGPASSLEPLLS